MSTQAAAKEQIKPELLPADLGGGQIQFIKRSDYARRTAETWSLKTKAEIKKDHVTQVLDSLDKGQRDIPGDENPQELVKLWDAVRADYDAAVLKVEEEQAKAEAEKAEAEAKAKAEAEANAALVQNAITAPLDFGSLSSKFDTGNMDRFIPKEDVTDEELVTALRMGLQLTEFTGWVRGDLVVELEKRGKLNVVKTLSEQMGIPYSNVYNDARTARRFPPELRKKDVKFTVYREVGAAKWTVEQERTTLPALVNEIAEGKHNSQTVREGVRKAQGKKEPEKLAPEDDPNHQFIMIDPGIATEDVEKGIQLVTGIPKDQLGGGVVIINPKNSKRFMGYLKKVENRWVELGEYKSAAQEEAEKEKTPPPAAPAATPKKGGKGKK